MKNRHLIQQFINSINAKLLNLLEDQKDGLLALIDPNENQEISAHYGASHFAASLLIQGEHNEALYTKGKQLVASLIQRWEESHRLPAYHYDFNNFAFVICYDSLRVEDKSLKDQLRQIVLSSPDSNHYTINWLPMRLYVNHKRLEWTEDKKYQNRINDCIRLINEATNNDGGIEDRLPKGLSYNLQYNISSFAILSFERQLLPQYDFSKGLGFLLNKVAPDGDINYQGRGCNQVFAWGPWIYILSLYGLHDDLYHALTFLDGKLGIMLENNSMMLNSWNGKEKFLWWDYHYASVYMAYLLLWLVFALHDHAACKDIKPVLVNDLSTGLRSYETPDYYISVFEGRKEYLAEFGPTLNLLWTKRNGMIFKGGLGPWRGLFGNNNTNEDVVMLNHLGVISITRPYSRGIINRILNRLKISAGICKKKDEKLIKRPVFSPISIDEKEKELRLKWSTNDNDQKFFNFSTFNEFSDIKLFADGKEISMLLIGRIRNQYDWVNIYQSKISIGREWELVIPL